MAVLSTSLYFHSLSAGLIFSDVRIDVQEGDVSCLQNKHPCRCCTYEFLYVGSCNHYKYCKHETAKCELNHFLWLTGKQVSK